jgi:hypothetical protein
MNIVSGDGVTGLPHQSVFHREKQPRAAPLHAARGKFDKRGHGTVTLCQFLCADLSSACGRLINPAKEKDNPG